MSEEPIRAVATILEPLSQVTYRIALSNGKAIVGHVGRALTTCRLRINELFRAPEKWCDGHWFIRFPVSEDHCCPANTPRLV